MQDIFIYIWEGAFQVYIMVQRTWVSHESGFAAGENVEKGRDEQEMKYTLKCWRKH
jgi:hypothetical protein